MGLSYTTFVFITVTTISDTTRHYETGNHNLNLHSSEKLIKLTYSS